MKLAGRVLGFGLGVAAIAGGGGLVAGVLAPGSSISGPPDIGFEVPVTPMDLSVEPSSNSPLLVAHPTEPDFVVMANRMDAPDFSCALHLSGDNGRSWAETNPVPELPARPRHHSSARRWASARSMKLSPAKNDRRTKGTARSTRGLDRPVDCA